MTYLRRISVWQDDIVYILDNFSASVYVSAYCYDSLPSGIRNQLSERENFPDADVFAVGFDTYDDGVNGYRFELSAANVQADALKGTIRTKVPFKIGQRYASEPLTGLSLQDLRIYTRALAPAAAWSRSTR